MFQQVPHLIRMAKDGEQAASTVIYTRQEAQAITFEAGGSVLMDVEKYDILMDQ